MQLIPGKRISIHEIAKLFHSCFEKAGVWPLNPNLFTQVNFLPVELENRPYPTEQNVPDGLHPGLFRDPSSVMIDRQH